MRDLTLGLMIILTVVWVGAARADTGNGDDSSDRGSWKDSGDRDDKGHRNHKGGKEDFAPVPQTGQVISFDANIPKRDDGALQKGVQLPNPRFTDRGDGTIKDNLTGLIWLKNANCPNVPRDWQTALNDVASLNASGKMNGNDCGDTSGKKGTHRTDWRLPNIRELFSLVDFAFRIPAISNASGDAQCTPADCAFSNFQASPYWSSTAANDPLHLLAWGVGFAVGDVNDAGKTASPGLFVTAVRGGS